MLLLLLIILVLLFFLAIFVLSSEFYSSFKGAPFVPNDYKVIKESLRLAELKPSDVFVDLGSGDGRVLSIAVKEFRVKRAIGYEISPWPYLLSKIRVMRLAGGLRKRVTLFRKPVLEADLSKATVIYVYLFKGILEDLAPVFSKQMRRNKELRIVSPLFKIKGLIPRKQMEVFHKDFGKRVKVYVYFS